MMLQDAECLAAYAADGDGDAFAQLVNRNSGWIFAAAKRRLRDDHLAEDATQSVFILLAEKATEVLRSDRSSVAAWLFHVMHFTCSSIRRTRYRDARKEKAALGLDRSELSADNETLITMVEDTVANLPPRDREAVVRRFYQRESFADIGKSLGISAEAARKRVTRVLSQCREAIACEGIDAEPESLLSRDASLDMTSPRGEASAVNRNEIEIITGRTKIMLQQMKDIRFSVMTAEFYVNSVEDNLDFFEKLGFRRHFVEALDANGFAPRASLRGGHARIWLRRATPENTPAPGVVIYVWLDGGEEAVTRHRETIAAQGVAVNQFFYDGALMNFTVTSPDGYTIGFFSTYKPHTFDPALDG